MWKALAYYDSCMDVDEIERLKGEPLEKLIKEYGSWSITDRNWMEKDWDFVTNLARIHKDLVLSILFSMAVVIDNKNSSQNAITVRWSYFKPRLLVSCTLLHVWPRGTHNCTSSRVEYKVRDSTHLGCIGQSSSYREIVLLPLYL